MFLNAVRLGDFVYGTTGDFGPAFLTALDIKTGQSAWQHRGFGRASIVYADGKAIIMDEDGDLALARLAPEGVTVLSEAKKSSRRCRGPCRRSSARRSTRAIARRSSR